MHKECRLMEGGTKLMEGKFISMETERILNEAESK
jgi:hypothetical protein